MFDFESFSRGIQSPGRRVTADAASAAATAASKARLELLDQKADPYPVESHLVNEYKDDAALLVVYDTKNRPVCVFDHFILGSINEQDQDKSSFVFTFGDAVLFGGMERRTRLYAYSGFLIDSQKDGKCISAWRHLYDKYLRATAMADQSRYAKLFFRDQVRFGYITSCRLSEAADRPQTAVMNFNMFVLSEDI